MSYEDWIKQYKERGGALEENLSRIYLQTEEEILNQPGTSIVDLNLRLRELRATFEPRYCLMLYARTTDDKLLHQAWKATDLSDEDDLESARNLSHDLDLDKSMTALMMMLDNLCGLHLVMLERGETSGEETSEFEGPVRLNPPDDLWFEVMSIAAELAWVVIVVSKFGSNLIRELRYLSDAGLNSRVLLFTGQSFWWQESPTSEPLQRGFEDLSNAVHQAAESPAQLPDRDAINLGY